MDNADITNRFTYHPASEEQGLKYDDLRSAGLALATLIDRSAPNSREKSLAITKLEEAIMWANAAIARNE